MSMETQIGLQRGWRWGNRRPRLISRVLDEGGGVVMSREGITPCLRQNIGAQVRQQIVILLTLSTSMLISRKFVQ